MELKKIAIFGYYIYGTMLIFLEVLIITAVFLSESPIKMIIKITPCLEPSPYCQKCNSDSSHDLCIISKYIEPCGLMRLFGIAIAACLPVAVFTASVSICLKHLSSISWNTMLGTLYICLFILAIGVIINAVNHYECIQYRNTLLYYSVISWVGLYFFELGFAIFLGCIYIIQ